MCFCKIGILEKCKNYNNIQSPKTKDMNESLKKAYFQALYVKTYHSLWEDITKHLNKWGHTQFL